MGSLVADGPVAPIDKSLRFFFIWGSDPLDERVSAFYTQTYDASVPDWPGELDFYREMAAEVKRCGANLLEVACGTGRVAVRLAQDGVRVVGLDRSPSMLQVAEQKSAGLENVRWVLGDMRSFELGETFALVIIPGHSFQHLNSPQDQVECLECIKRHLDPGGTLVVHLDHQDLVWLGDLLTGKGAVFEPGEPFEHPRTGNLIRTFQAWSYERATQTAMAQTIWEEVGTDGRVIDRWQTGPVRLHCVFRFEMEHLLARVGLAVEGLYGDFFRQPLRDDSSEMIWVVRNE